MKLQLQCKAEEGGKKERKERGKEGRKEARKDGGRKGKKEGDLDPNDMLAVAALRLSMRTLLADLLPFWNLSGASRTKADLSGPGKGNLSFKRLIGVASACVLTAPALRVHYSRAVGCGVSCILGYY